MISEAERAAKSRAKDARGQGALRAQCAPAWSEQAGGARSCAGARDRRLGAGHRRAERRAGTIAHGGHDLAQVEVMRARRAKVEALATLARSIDAHVKDAAPARADRARVRDRSL